MGKRVPVMKITDTSPKKLMVSYDESRDFPVSLGYPVGTELDIDKDAAILAAGISTLIRLAEHRGESGADVLRSVVTQLEETFVDVNTNVKTKDE
jgi:hypothetical protein